MELKKWLREKTGLEVAETAFRKTTTLPYLIFDDDKVRRGADEKRCITEHNITLYLCQEIRDKNLELKLEEVLEEQVEYTKNVSFDKNDGFYITEYFFEQLEIGKEE